MFEILITSIKDFFTPRFLFLATAPLLFSGALIALLVAFGGFGIFELFSELSADEGNLPQALAWLVHFVFIKWIVSALFVVLGAYALPIFSILIALFITSFLTATIAKEINKRHYNQDNSPELGLASTLLLSGVATLKFIGLFIICLPLLLLPVIGFLAFNIPFFYLYYRLMLIDVASACLNKNECESLFKAPKDGGFIASCLAFYLLSLFPFVALFAQVFFVIFLSHLLFRRKALACAV